MFQLKKAPVIDCCPDYLYHPNDPICQQLLKKGKMPLKPCIDPIIDQDETPLEEELEPLPDWLLELLIKLRETENPTTNEYRIFADGLQNQGMSRRAQALTEFILRESLSQVPPASEADLVALGQVAVCHAQACRALENNQKEQISRVIAATYLTASDMKASGGSSTEIENLVQAAWGLIDSLNN
ncbi:MAG: hypothetical protein WA040_19565 [Anaerolineae bacterium]